MSNSFFAPLSIDVLTVTASEFRIADSPAENMTATLDVKLDHEESFDANSKHGLMQLLDISLSLADREDKADVRLFVCVTVQIVTTISGTAETSEYQRASSVSIAYGHARTCINTIVAMSQMGGYIIPAIDPQALLRQIDEKQEAD